MKSIKIITTLGAVAVTALLAVSCAKDKGKIASPETYNFTNSAFVQEYNATLNSTRNYIYVDGNVITGAAIAYGGIFPATPANASVTAGYRIFLIKDTLGTSTQPAMSFAETLQANNFYTIFTYDTSTSVKKKTVVNNIVIPSDTTARLRFANFIYNPTILPTGFDIFSVKRNAVIFTNVHETEVTDFIPYASALTDTFYIRPNGSSTNLQNFITAGTPPGSGAFANIQAVLTPTRLRSYTLIFRGGYRTSVSTVGPAYTAAAASLRTLTTFANY